MRRFTGYLLTLAGVCCAFVMGAALARPGTSVEASVELQPPARSQAACTPGWQFVSSPNPAADKSYLNSVAAASPSDVWAVGYQVTGNIVGTLIEHWDGTQWAIVPSPNAIGLGNSLSGVIAIAPDDAWAVGQTSGGLYMSTLVQHWDGTQWTIVPSPNGPDDDSYLKAVTALPANDVWAVGVDLDTQNIRQLPLVEHWDGTQWTFADMPPVLGGLNAVTANSPDDVWAVGANILHWNGKEWRAETNPVPPADRPILNSVAALSTDNVWAVGSTGDAQSGTNRALIEHWDGVQWTVLPGLDPGPYATVLQGVVAFTDNDIWAAGYMEDTGRTTLMIHWDGATWTRSVSPNPSPIINPISDIAAAGSRMWAVGNFFHEYGGYRTLIETYDRSCATPTPSSTTTPTSSPPPSFTPGPLPTCALSWEVVASPNNGDYLNNELTDIDVVSPADMWAVGTMLVDALALHWDGSIWTIVPTADIGDSFNAIDLNAVSAISSNDVWAVGSYRIDQGPFRTLAEHWDGTRWSIVPTPNVGRYGNQLYAIDALSPDDIWAVGEDSSGMMALHWDGVEWSVIPNPGPEGGALQSVEAISANDVWAVGGNTIQHWDGSSWSIVPHPDPGGANFTSVSGPAGNDVWAVGWYRFESYWPLIEHWDGVRWRVIAPYNAGAGPTLSGVAATSRNNAWAVGDNYSRLLTLHWDGSRWDSIPGASVGATERNLQAVAISPSGEAWAVGSYRDPTTQAKRTLVERTTDSFSFIDVPPAHTFYPYVHCLVCRGIISGYSDSTFRPEQYVTRGQLGKIVVNAAQINQPIPLPPDRQTFEDVPINSTFWRHIEQLAQYGAIKGYPCDSGPGEPCIPPLNRPYFRPSASSSRQQIAQVIDHVAQYGVPCDGQTFEDVPPGHDFYCPIQRLSQFSIVAGYPCGGPGEPCVAPLNRPYFRPGNSVTRGQLAKIAAITFHPECVGLSGR